MTTPVRRIAEHLVTALARAGTPAVFGVPGGGSNLDVLGAAEAAGIPFVLAHTETAAAVMAAVAGQLSGAPGACVVTRGPGVTSAVNGVAQARLDRQPVVLVSDCVSAAQWARVSHQRVDQHALLAPVTKGSFDLVHDDPAEAAAAVALALAEPPGPVQVSIDPGAASLGRTPAAPAAAPSDEQAVEQLAAAVAAAHRPVMVVGGGLAVLPPAARDAVAAAVRRLAERHRMPVLGTYLGRGIVPDRHPWHAGVATGATIESPVLHEADLVLGVGLDPVEFIPAPWSYAADVVLLGTWPVDDSTYLGDRLTVQAVVPVERLAGVVDGLAAASTWTAAEVDAHRSRAHAELLAAVPTRPRGLTPQQVVTEAAGVAPSGTTLTVDAGAHMLVAVPLWPAERPCQVLISSGLATMGFAVPAAVAAAVVAPDRHVVCCTGDGGLGMVLGEIETLGRLQLPVVVLVCNDATLSLIAAKQHPVGHGGDGAVAYRRTDFAAVARASGVHGETVADVATYRRVLREAFDRPGPTLLDVQVDPSAYGAVLDAVRAPRPAAAG